MSDFAPFFATDVASGWTGYDRIFPNAQVWDQLGGKGRALVIADYDNSGQVQASGSHLDVDHIWKLGATGGEGQITIAWRGTLGSGANLQPDNCYMVGAYWTAAGALNGRVSKRVAGVVSDLKSEIAIPGFTFLPGEMFVRVQHIGTAIKVKVWAGTLVNEPSVWFYEGVDSSHASGRWATSSSGYATSAGKVHEFDGPAAYVSPTASAGPDQSVAAGATVTLSGTPPGGTWSQDSGPAVTLSAAVTDATNTRTTFSAANTSTTASVDRIFRYTQGTA